MKIFVVLIAIILIIILITIRVKHLLGRRKTEFEIIQSQHLINKAMNNLFAQTNIKHGLNLPDHLNSTLIANIWGHNVMAFEIQVEYERRVDPKFLQQNFNNELKKYCFQQKIPQIDHEIAPIIITDLWYEQIKPILHIDVAYVNNQQTLSYLHDLKKLNQPFQT